MRKPRRLSNEELLPYQWQMPRTTRFPRGLTTQCEIQAPETAEPSRSESPAEPSPIEQAAVQYKGRIDWSELFGNDRPVEIEVGMGKGLFLLTSALGRPETNFFGIEIVRKYQLFATTRFALRKLPNVKTVCADARWVLDQFVPDGTLAAIHVYFPDPWWKARHKKRRVFTQSFAASAAKAIRPGGTLYIASDVEEYFGVMTEIVRSQGSFQEVRRETSTASLESAGYQTNFERKARLKGMPVWRAEYERLADHRG